MYVLYGFVAVLLVLDVFILAFLIDARKRVKHLEGISGAKPGEAVNTAPDK